MRVTEILVTAAGRILDFTGQGRAGAGRSSRSQCEQHAEATELI